MASKQINISVPEQYAVLLEELAELTGDSMSAIANRALIEKLENAITSGLLAQLRGRKKLNT